MIFSTIGDMVKKLLRSITGKELRSYVPKYSDVYYTTGYAYPPSEPYSLEDYKSAVDNDTTIPRALDTLIYSVLDLITEYSHPNKEIEYFVKENLNQMRGTIKTAMYQLLYNAMVYGFGLLEKIWGLDGDRIVLRELRSIDPMLVNFVIDRQEELKIKAVRVFYVGKGYYEIPPEKVVIYRHLDKSSVFGKSRLTRVMKIYKLKQRVIEWWGRAVQKYGEPPIKVSFNSTLDFRDEKTRSALDDIAGQLANLHHNPIFFETPDYDVEIKTFPNLGADFNQLINKIDEMIYNAILLPPLLAGGDKGGSYALGKKHFDLYMMACSFIASEIIDVIIEQVIRDLVEYNFGIQKSYGRFGKKKLDVDKLDDMMKIFNQANNIGLLVEEDKNRIREILGLPPAELQKKTVAYSDIESLTKAVERLEKSGVLDDELKRSFKEKIKSMLDRL